MASYAMPTALREYGGAPRSTDRMATQQFFDFGGGPVPAHRHIHGGGWVAETARVGDSVFVGPDNGRVSSGAR